MWPQCARATPIFHAVHFTRLTPVTFKEKLKLILRRRDKLHPGPIRKFQRGGAAIFFFFIYFWEEKLLLLFIRIPITFTLQYIILYIYTRLADPNLEHLTQVFLSPYIIPILGLNRPVSSRLCRAFCRRDGDGRQDGRRPESSIPCLLLLPNHLFAFILHHSLQSSTLSHNRSQHTESQTATFAALYLEFRTYPNREMGSDNECVSKNRYLRMGKLDGQVEGSIPVTNFV